MLTVYDAVEGALVTRDPAAGVSKRASASGSMRGSPRKVAPLCSILFLRGMHQFPEAPISHALVIESRLVAERAGDAQKEYERMIELNPPKVEAVRRWWENHPLRQQARGRSPL